MTIISSRQCFGGGGSSSGANVNRNSTPHTPHRYLTFTRRISPAGGGGGNGVVKARNMPIPTRHNTTIITTPAPTHSTEPNVTATTLINNTPSYPQSLWKT